MFLFTLIRILPQDANFIGCFSEKKIRKGHYFGFYKPSGFFNGFINWPGSGKGQNMNKLEVSEALERNGFKIVDMTKFRGLTYFNTRKTSRLTELIT